MEPTTPAPPSRPHRDDSPDLTASLEVWDSEGLIRRADADAIAAFEDTGPSTAPARQVTPVAEALAYLGGALAVAAGGTALGGEWSRLSTGFRTGTVAAIWLVLFVVGWRLHDPQSPALERLSRVLWLLSALSLAWTAQLVVDEGFGSNGRWGFEAAGVAMAIYAGALYLARPNTLQQLAFAIGLLLVTVSFTEDSSTRVGWGIWLLGIIWMFLGWRRVLVAAGAALVIGSMLVLAGALFVAIGAEEVGAWLAVLSSAGLIATGVGLRRIAVMVIGTVALFFSTFATIQQYVEGSAGIAVGLLVAGALVLTVAFAVARLGRGSRAPAERAS
jgi:hypothetical protein